MLLQGQPQQPGAFPQVFLFAIIIGIFYFIVFMPARRRQKKLQEMVDTLKNGDKVITNGGIYGTIVGFKGDRIQLRIAENVKIELSRSAVTALQSPEEEEK